MSGSRAIITFLFNAKTLGGVDLEFLPLVKRLHRIPFCATFGVSCAGHISVSPPDYGGGDTVIIPERFWPEPYGHLNIAVLPQAPHIPELLKLIRTVVEAEKDASFKRVSHCFGPPEGSPIEIWEIRIFDAGTMASESGYCGGEMIKDERKDLFDTVHARVEEIKAFWTELDKKVGQYCKNHGFTSYSLSERPKELKAYWDKPQTPNT